MLEHSPAEAAVMDAAMARARPGLGFASVVRVGLLGEAGVGKSTLINALLSERLSLLPQGGVGPLTAVPIDVRYASSPYLRVKCLGRERIAGLLQAVTTHSPPTRYPDPEPPERTELCRMAKLLACDDQFAGDAPERVVSFLKAWLSAEMSALLEPGLVARAKRARRVAELGDSEHPYLEIEAGLDLPGLLLAFSHHAAGFLVPLTEHIELGWDSPLLSAGVSLVDLPGLGIANDSYRCRTLRAIADLDAILVVVDRAGLTQAVADLLRERESFDLSRASLEARELRKRALIVVATKLDQPAAEMIAARRLGHRTATWREVYSECAARAQTVLRSQLDLLISQVAASGPPTALRGFDTPAPIWAVFPQEYQRLHRADPEEASARIADPAASGIPALLQYLRQLAQAGGADLVRRCEQALTVLMRGPARGAACGLRRELGELTSKVGEAGEDAS